MHRASLYLAFACSGAAALIYEITWTRLLTLFMGHTVAAASTVLAAFMGGLAIGAAVSGRLATRLERAAALRAYAGVEVAIALLALALPAAIAAARPLLTATYADGDPGAPFAVARLGCALLVVTVPAIAMGATLPLLVRFAVRDARSAGSRTGALYAWNTAGAAAGALLSGFVLLPALGVRASTYVAVALNILSAAIAWRLGGGAAAPVAADEPHTAVATPTRRVKRASAERQQPPPAAPRWVPAAALGLSGCASLVLQIAWTRIVALVIGPTTFAFSAVVATFIAGIAAGAFVGARLARRTRSAWPLAGSLLAVALAATAAALYAPRIPLLVAQLVSDPAIGFGAVVRAQTLLIAALMMPMTVAFGAAFPLAVHLAATRDASVSRDVANVYTVNTAGAIAGALAGGFWLVPAFGLQGTVRIAAAAAVVGFALVALATDRRRTMVAVTIALSAAAIAAAGLVRPWDPELLSSGAYKYAPYLTVEHREAMLRAGTLLYYREGAAATVSVRELAGSRSLAIDGKVDASNAGDMLTQKLLAHLPLLLHSSPRRVGIVGLGSGVTLGAALRHPIAVADSLEISPEVVEASDFFRRENRDALGDARSRLIVGDGRSHLLLGRTAYDVIISEPSNPWMAGVASLFTREFFEAARARLAPGGVLCQWAHTYDISDADLRSIVATFLTVFPDGILWLVGDGDVLLTGSNGPLDVSAVADGWSRPGVAADLETVGLTDPATLLSFWTASGDALRAYTAGALIQTDDRTALEFSAPRSIYGRGGEDHAAVLRALRTNAPLPAAVHSAWNSETIHVNRGRVHLGAEAFRAAYDDYLRALERRPDDEQAVAGLLKAAAPAGRMPEVEERLRTLLGRNPRNVAAAVAVSRIRAARGEFAPATEILRPLFEGVPDLRALEQLASIFADANDVTRLAAVVADMQRVAPDADATLYYSASQLFMAGQHAEAAAVAERLRARSPGHARAHNLVGAALGSLGRHEDARTAFERAIAADPRDATAYVNLGTFELARGNADAAAERFAEALTLDPSSPPARAGLAEALGAQ